VEACRWEDWRPESPLDAVTARALGDYEALAGWAGSQLKPGGKLVLWLGLEEATRLRRLPSWNWDTTPIPASRERGLLVGVPPSTQVFHVEPLLRTPPSARFPAGGNIGQGNRRSQSERRSRQDHYGRQSRRLPRRRRAPHPHSRL